MEYHMDTHPSIQAPKNPTQDEPAVRGRRRREGLYSGTRAARRVVVERRRAVHRLGGRAVVAERAAGGAGRGQAAEGCGLRVRHRLHQRAEEGHLHAVDHPGEHGPHVQIWRRSYDIPPPLVDESSEYWPGSDPRYADVPVSELPKAESLMLTEKRFLVEWEKTIAPMIKTGKRVVIAAHGNSLRALVKHLDGISSEDIPSLNIPTGIPLVYELDANLAPLKHPQALAPLSGYYLGDQDEIRARIQVRVLACPLSFRLALARISQCRHIDSACSLA
eukprot:scaffold748_cov251-Pinguiococcus_pyrenoidosus.AAC.12